MDTAQLPADVVFGSVSHSGYVMEETDIGEGKTTVFTYTLAFDQSLGSWGFTDSLDSRVWYYDEFAWGNADQTWYLRNDYHDIYTQVGGFWPLSAKAAAPAPTQIVT